MTCLIASYHLARFLCLLLVWISKVRYSLSTWLNAQQKSRWKINYLMAKKKEKQLNHKESGHFPALFLLWAVVLPFVVKLLTKWTNTAPTPPVSQPLETEIPQEKPLILPHCGFYSLAEPLDAVLKQEMSRAMTRWVFLLSPTVLTHSLKHYFFTFIRKAGILF